MNNWNPDVEIYLILFTTLILFMSLSGFIIYFIVLYRKKQSINLIEREKLEVQFQQEILKTQLEVQEQTMQTIGADLHDNIGQLLSLTSLTLGSIEINEVNKAQQKIDTALDLNSRCIKELRLLGKLLQGEQLIGSGLAEAINYEIAWMEKAGQYTVNYQTENYCTESCNADKDLLVFRILQEILNNIIKHAFASQINIKLDCRNSCLQLLVEDNGIGFSTDAVPGKQEGMGLHNIRKRAELMDGEIDIASRPGTGTRVTLKISYP